MRALYIFDGYQGQLAGRADERKVTLELDDAARRWLANAGYDPVYGARPLKRVIQRELQNPLATQLLEGKIREGQTVHVTASGLGLVIQPTAQDEVRDVKRRAAS